MSKFKVGEVVVIYAKGKNAGYNGTEATILECFTGSLGSAYILDFEPEYNADGTRRHNGKPNGWYEFCLRKNMTETKRPHGTQLKTSGHQVR